MPSEFALIQKYFTRPDRPYRQTLLGVGDDAALIVPRQGCELAVSTDMLVSGTHFLADTDPQALGWKTLAVNLSDLAAMGAKPRWAFLAAALPQLDEGWIAAFTYGLFACADAFDVDLSGGDTTRGPLNFCVTVIGEVPAGQALKRSNAKTGDDLWVSGAPGLAALGLAQLQGRVCLPHPDPCLTALYRPQPRVTLGQALVGEGLAHAAIDISDGLLADLTHILDASALAARVECALLPTAALQQGAVAALAQECLLAGGDDYELLFTAAPAQRHRLHELSAELDLPLTRIGAMVAGKPGTLEVLGSNGQSLTINRRGFDHFAENRRTR